MGLAYDIGGFASIVVIWAGLIAGTVLAFLVALEDHHTDDEVRRGAEAEKRMARTWRDLRPRH